MRVVLDTNILVSGSGWSSGPPAKILDAWAAQVFSLIISDEVFEEYKRVLSDFATRHEGLEIGPLLESIVSKALLVSPELLPSSVCTDPDDDKFIAAALAGNARYIVSGDTALLKVRVFRKIEIIRPAKFVSLLGGVK